MKLDVLKDDIRVCLIIAHSEETKSIVATNDAEMNLMLDTLSLRQRQEENKMPKDYDR